MKEKIYSNKLKEHKHLSFVCVYIVHHFNLSHLHLFYTHPVKYYSMFMSILSFMYTHCTMCTCIPFKDTTRVHDIEKYNMIL